MIGHSDSAMALGIPLLTPFSMNSECILSGQYLSIELGLKVTVMPRIW